MNPEFVGLLIAAAMVGAATSALLLSLQNRRGLAAASAPGQSRKDELFRVAFERSPVGIALIGLDGSWLQVNPRLLTLLGSRREELLRTPLKELIHPDDRPFEEAQRKRLLAGEIPALVMDVRLLSRDRKVTTFRMNTSICRRGPGDVQYYEYVFDTVPEKLISRAAQSLETALEHLDDVGVLRVGTGGKIASWSRGAELILGYKQEEVIGKSRSLLYPDIDVTAGAPESDGRQTTQHGRFDREASMVRRDGLVISVQVTFLKSPDGGTLALIRRPAGRPRVEEGADASAAAIERMTREIAAARESHAQRVAGLQQELREHEEARTSAEQASAESRSLIARLKVEGERKIAELLRRIDVLKNEVRRREGIERSLRAGFQELRSGGEKSVDELHAMTVALRDEIERRRRLESVVEELRSSSASSEPQARASSPRIDAPAAEDVAREWLVFEGAELSETFDTLEARGATGTALLRHDDEHARIYFEEGLVVGCLSSVPRPPIGEQLVADGTISNTQRDRALDIQEQTGIAFGRILLIMNALEFDQLFTVMRDRAATELAAVLTWSPVAYAFADDVAPPEKLVPLRLPLRDLLQPAETEARLIEEIMTDSPQEVAVAIETQPVNEAQVVVAAEAADGQWAGYVGGTSKRSRKFHELECRSADRIPAESRVMFATRGDAESSGYEACALCVGRQRRQPS